MQVYNNEYMSNIEKVKTTFVKQGHPLTTRLRRAQFNQFLNSLISGDQFTPDISQQIWEQSAEGREQVSVQQLCNTIVDAQNIIQGKLFQLSDEIKTMQEDLNNMNSPNKHRQQMMINIKDMEEQKQSFEDDLRMLTEPFGISMVSFMSMASKSRKVSGSVYNQFAYSPTNDVKSELELKWLFFLCAAWGLFEIIVIYKKYDFLNLMVLASLMFIFLMNQLDSTYMKFTLGLLVVSELLDMIWLFMNANDFWNPQEVGTNSTAEKGYLKFIVILTFIGVFLKIPLGVFLYHYRNIEQTKQYSIDLGIVKMQLTPTKQNPISEGIRNTEMFN